jgi:hypothetical protein
MKTNITWAEAGLLVGKVVDGDVMADNLTDMQKEACRLFVEAGLEYMSPIDTELVSDKTDYPEDNKPRGWYIFGMNNDRVDYSKYMYVGDGLWLRTDLSKEEMTKAYEEAMEYQRANR